MTMLERVKLLLGITDNSKDSILTLLITDAQSEALSLTNIAVYSTILDTTVSKMVVINYNRLGQEGVTSQSYSGASENYTEGYPEPILALLRSFRKVKML